MEDLLRQTDWHLTGMLSNEYIDLLRQYYYVGGMPAAVKAYVEGNGLTTGE